MPTSFDSASPINAVLTPPIPTTASQAPLIVNTHPMTTRSKDGTFKPKALVAMPKAIPLAPIAAPHTSSCTSNADTVQCTKSKASSCTLIADTVQYPKSKNVSSAPKLDYSIIEPLTYKIAAQYPQWCSAMDDEFAALQRQGTSVLVPPSPT